MTKSIAIIGMATILPGAADIAEYWSNILEGKDCITDIPDNYWDIEDFYDPDPSARDKTYGYKAGVISPIEFDSIGFGIPPAAMESISVEQLYALVVAKQALLDADLIGKNAKPFNKDKTGVILAAGIGKNAFSLNRRQDIPRFKKILFNCGAPEALIERALERLRDADLEWTENSEPGFLPNVTAGRVANRFNLKGTNCVVDAACASGLAALKIAIGELQSGDCDVVLTGGVLLDLTSTAFISFCKTPAISKENICKPFDADANGMVLGDGVAMVVLKRLEDAERDNDRIYAVIKSVGSSGDGRAKSIFAPSAEGQIKAFERAYDKADVHPASISLIEAHGTGTFVGDECELTALSRFFGEYGAKQGTVAIGSVKSQIGHTRLTAGIAGLIKAALALYHRTLPPTINICKERPDLAMSPFYTLASPKPWITGDRFPIRRAGLSSLGFGGTNYHAVLEEYVRTGPRDISPPRLHRIPAGICLSAADNNALIDLCENTIDLLLADTAAYDGLLDEQHDPEAIPIEQPRIGLVAKDREDVVNKLKAAAGALRTNDCRDEFQIDGEGIYYRAAGITADAKIVTLFSGQGTQYPGMFNEIARDYPEMAGFFNTVGAALEENGLTPIADILYIPEARRKDKGVLNNTEYAQPALAAVCGGIYEILRNRGYADDFLIGHSFGEITGLWAGGAIDARTFANITVARGKAMAMSGGATGMLIAMAGRAACEQWIKEYKNLYIANENSIDQTSISGAADEIKALAAELKNAKVSCTILNVSQAFHSPYMSGPNALFREALGAVKFKPLKKTLYSGADGKPYGKGAPTVKETIARQIEMPVRFMQCVEDAFEKGARVFVEIGPGKVLSNLVRKILDNKKIYAIAVNGAKSEKSAHVQLEEALVNLRVLGLKINGDVYRRRIPDLYKDEKPKSAYFVDPIVYLTPAKKAIIDIATNTVDTADTPTAKDSVRMDDITEPSNALEGLSNLKGVQTMERGAPDVVFGIQNLNSKALEKFLASQGQQINAFMQLMKDTGEVSMPNDLLKLMETFQNNSMRAFEAYMKGQREILAGMEGASMIPAEPAASARLLSDAWAEPVTEANMGNTGLLESSPPHLRAETPANVAPVTLGKVDIAVKGAPVIIDKDISSFAEANNHDPGLKSNLDTGSESAFEDIDPVQVIIKIISNKTGYPEDMVDADMNIESDLGIDSIKRIEVLSELSNQIPGKLKTEDIEEIAMLHTIKEIGDYLKKK